MRPARCRAMVDHLRGAWRVSARRACAVLRAPRSTYHHRPRRDAQATLRKRIREIAETRVRYGFRRIHVLLQREGWVVNHKRVQRLYRLEGLQLRNKTRSGRSRPSCGRTGR
jgi:putative transposase